MNRKLIFSIAWSLLLARWRQTLVAAVGVAFSVTMFIALLSFMIGLNKMLDDLFLNRSAHIRLYNDIEARPSMPIERVPAYAHSYCFASAVQAAQVRKDIYNSGGILNALRNDNRILGISAKITSPAFFNKGTARLNGTLTGVNPEDENRVLHFYDYIVKGSGASLNFIPGSVVLGKALADILQVDLGGRIYITTPRGVVYPLQVIALYQSGLTELDKTTAYVSVSTAHKLLNLPVSYLTDIQIRLTQMKEAPAIAQQYQQYFQIKAEAIQPANAELETGTSIRTLIAYLVGITLLVVAGFGIYNILNMMIYEKMDTIAILKATGFSPDDVRSVFLIIATGIGLAGGLAGLFCGLG
ncbi:MAG TPA: ABC transporter permease, partial [Flavisolibacter sp.]|nr:ABC transporter permease [Flavisolibacter sp.]